MLLQRVSKEGLTSNWLQKKSDVGLMNHLLEAGADVNAPAAPRRGMTALQAAATNRRRNVVDMLLKDMQMLMPRLLQTRG